MKKLFGLFSLLLATTVFAGPPVVWGPNNSAQLLTPNLSFNKLVDVKTGTVNPSVTATDGVRGTLYIRHGGSGGQLYIKQDNGATTNWNEYASSCPTTGLGDVTHTGDSYGAPMTLGTGDAQPLYLQTNGTARVAIDSAGNFGFGTNTQSDASSTNKYFFFSTSDGTGVNKNYTGLYNEVSLTDPTDGSGYQQGAYNVVHAEHNTGTYALLRNYNMGEMAGDGTVTEIYGNRSLARIFDKNAPSDTSSGIVENMYGMEAYANNTSTAGIVRNATGLLISHAKATGTDPGHIHVARGLWIPNDVMASGGDTNIGWAIDSESTQPSRISGDVQLWGNKALIFTDGNYHELNLKAPASMSASIAFTLPGQDGSNGQCIVTNGSGVLSFASCGGGGGGSGDVNFGGNTFGAAKAIGSTDGYKFSLMTNGTNRLNITSSGVVTIGGDVGDMSPAPVVFGTYKFDTVDSSSPFVAFENYFASYGDSSSSRDGTVFSLALRPGESNFTYSGEYSAQSVKAYVNAPGAVALFNGNKVQVSTLNGTASIYDAKGSVASIIAPSGVIRRATAFEAQDAAATGTDDADHTATGVSIGTSGAGVLASGSTGVNRARGLYIADTITATAGSGSAEAFEIQSESAQPSRLKGGLQIVPSGSKPTCASGIRGTYWYTAGGTGVKDAVEVCTKDASDVYAWRTIY